MMQVVVYGSRTLPDSDIDSLSKELTCLQLVFDKLKIHFKQDKFEIVTGMAYGADLVGLAYAEHVGWPPAKYPADWKRLGQQAGFIRNIRMASLPGLVAGIEFWDGVSGGTKHMRHNLSSREIPVVEISFSSYIVRTDGYRKIYALESLRLKKKSLEQFA